MNMKLNKKHIIILLLAVILTCFVILVESVITDKLHIFDASTEIGLAEDTYSVDLEMNSALRQTFSMPYDYFTGVNLTFYNEYVYSEGIINISICDDSDNTIAQWEWRAGMLENGLDHECRVNPIKVKKGELYSIDIKNLSDGRIRCKASEENTYDGGEMSIDGIVSGDVDAIVFGRNKSADSTIYFAIIFFIAAMLMIWGGINQFCVNPENSEIVSIENRIIGIVSACVLIALYAFTMTQYGDLNITILHSKELLSCIRHGEFMSFYDVTWEKALIGDYLEASPYYSAYYNILLYLALAVIILPIRLFECVFPNIIISNLFYIMWVEFFLCIILLASARIIDYICSIQIKNKLNCKMVALFYLTSAVTLFSTVGFGQLDIIPTLLMLLGVKKYLEKKNMMFVVFFSIAISMKSLALLVFVPLVLVREKNIIKVLVDLCGGIAMTFVSSMVFSASPGYIVTKATLDNHYKFIEGLFGAQFPIGVGPVSYFVLIYLAVCLSAYKCKKDTYITALKYSLLGLLPFFLFVTWHPQWFSMLTPFLCLALPFVWNEAVSVHSLIFMGLFYWAGVNMCYPTAVDNYMINRGLLPLITKHVYEGVTIKSMLININSCWIIITSAFFILLSAYVFMCIKELEKNNGTDQFECKNTWLMLENSFVSFFIIIIYFFLYFFVS